MSFTFAHDDLIPNPDFVFPAPVAVAAHAAPATILSATDFAAKLARDSEDGGPAAIVPGASSARSVPMRCAVACAPFVSRQCPAVA